MLATAQQVVGDNRGDRALLRRSVGLVGVVSHNIREFVVARERLLGIYSSIFRGECIKNGIQLFHQRWLWAVKLFSDKREKKLELKNNWNNLNHWKVSWNGKLWMRSRSCLFLLFVGLKRHTCWIFLVTSTPDCRQQPPIRTIRNYCLLPESKQWQ